MWTWLSRYQNVSILDFIGAKGDGGGQHLGGGRDGELAISRSSFPSFLQAGCPCCRPTNSVKALKGKKEADELKNRFGYKGVPRIFHWGPRTKGRSPRGGGVLGEGVATPLHQLGVWGAL